MSFFSISRWDPSVDDFSSLFAIFDANLSPSGWSLPQPKLLSLLDVPNGTTFVARAYPSGSSSPILGFATTYTLPSSLDSPILKGSLALIAVLPSHHHQGIGTLLHEAAVAHLRELVVPTLPLPLDQEPSKSKRSLQLGSVFPRIWPGLPTNLGSGMKGWFESRGWAFGPSASMDLYRTVGEGEKDQGGRELVGRLAEQGVTYGVMEKGREEELYAFQKENFATFAGWPEMFPKLIESGHMDDILCAYGKGRIIGALVASNGDPSGPMQQGLTWPCTIGKQCGTISCVGVAAASRLKGTGIGMVFTATRYLAGRGCDGIFIDWVALPGMKGFYERAGYEEMFKYENDAVL